MLPQSLIIEVINSLHLPSQSILSSLKIFVSFDPTSSVDDCVPRHPVCCTQDDFCHGKVTGLSILFHLVFGQ